MKRIILHSAFVALFASLIVFNANAQESTAQSVKTDDAKSSSTPEKVAAAENPKTILTETPSSDDEKEIIPFYRNYLERYTLGPTDVISVEVFGQCPNYCKTGITIPPDGRIQYPLIRGGVFVAGRTIDDVTKEIVKKLDEYIIDPQVTITLDKAMSSRYSVLGKVSSPGVRVMERRVTLWEAVVEAGGVTKEGNRKKVMLYRYGPQGDLTAQMINLDLVASGKSPMIELRPGDQVFVPGSKSNLKGIFTILEKASLVRFLFGFPL